VATTIAYNHIEGAVAITAAAAASSTALVGFGLDSPVEVASAGAVAWQLACRGYEERERLALGIIAVSFFASAAYVTVETVQALVREGEVGSSTVGIALAATSLVVMRFLSLAQRRSGRELGSARAVAEPTPAGEANGGDRCCAAPAQELHLPGPSGRPR
jgi:hypothetical protein